MICDLQITFFFGHFIRATFRFLLRKQTEKLESNAETATHLPMNFLIIYSQTDKIL